MARVNTIFTSFNRGIIDPRGLARVDVKRVQLSAEEQVNWIPRALGSMTIRPGLIYTGSTASNNFAVHAPFVFSLSDTAILEFSNQLLRVKISETPITRPSVSTAVSNGTFATDLSGWTDADESGATSAWTNGSAYGVTTGGYLGLTGTGFNAAVRTQTLTISGADQNIEHALRIVVARGPVTLRLGSSSGGDEYIAETTLGTGTHSLSFTPAAGSAYIQISASRQYVALVDSITIESSGVMTLTTPWLEADLRKLRWEQSADVVYAACAGYQQYKIERRAARSWSIVKYEPEDGPFRVANTGRVRLTPSALNGDITLTATSAFFKSTNVGSLFRLTSIGQNTDEDLSGEDQYTTPIRVTGTGTQRQFNFTLSGTYTATVTLQRSVGEVGAWVDIANYSAGSNSYNDALDNQVIYYRFGIKTGDYTSGTVTIVMSYASGGLTGILRVTSFTSATSVGAIVLTPLGATDATGDWSEGEWSSRRGYPSAMRIYESRMWQAGKSKIWGSISDAYEGYDDTFEGDAGPISRSIGSGPQDDIYWLLAMQRLVLGAGIKAHTVRSSSFDEPITPTAFALRSPVTQGSGNVDAVQIDTSGVFVDNSLMKLMLLSLDSASFDYVPEDLTEFVPEIGQPGFVKIAVQRKPDTRIHCVRSDGTVAVLLFNQVEDIRCWVEVTTRDGDAIEDVVIVPANTATEDKVYYAVRRDVNGSTVRYLERWALESECVGGTVSKLGDAGVAFTQASSTVVTVGTHLAGEQVVVWANGKDYSEDDEDGDQTTYLVSGGGTITLPEAVTDGYAGLPYDAFYKSVKLAYGSQSGTAINQKKRVEAMGFLLYKTHIRGVYYGPDETYLDPLPLEEEGEIQDENTVYEQYDKDMSEFNGEYSTDSRICLRGRAPRAATVTGFTFTVGEHESR